MGKSEHDVPNQTKRYFIESFCLLLYENEYRNISIAAIAQKAGFARRTFYRYFKSKDDVLAETLDEIFDEYSEEIIGEQDVSLNNIAKVFFKFWSRRLAFLEALDRSKLLPFLLDVMNKKIPLIYHHINGDTDEYGDKEERRYVLTFGIGGFWNLLILWMRDGAEKDPKDFALMMERVVHALYIKSI